MRLVRSLEHIIISLTHSLKFLRVIDTQLKTGKIHTDLPELPALSGERADWPEFKCVWQSLANSQFQTRLQLELELKKSCTKGRARQILEHIYATSMGAYGEIWSTLKDEYDDPGGETVYWLQTRFCEKECTALGPTSSCERTI